MEEKIKLTKKQEDLLRECAKSNITTLRCAVSDYKHTPDDVLDELSTDINWYVRSNVATNPSTPKETLLKIYQQDESETIKRWNILQKTLL